MTWPGSWRRWGSRGLRSTRGSAVGAVVQLCQRNGWSDVMIVALVTLGYPAHRGLAFDLHSYFGSEFYPLASEIWPADNLKRSNRWFRCLLAVVQR